MEGSTLQFLRIRHIADSLIAQFPPVAPVGLIFAACALSGCSIAIPMASSADSALWGGAPEDVTGSIRKPAPRLSGRLDSEDERRALVAMGAALDPQGNGASVKWNNPKSGAKGSFAPAGSAYPLEGKICRAFVADIEAGENAERLKGAACRGKSAEWTLTEAKPIKG